MFILKPGQHLLINKGRLHAFRKMTFDELPENDCHAQLRKNMIAELKAQNIRRPPLCVSVAFDWYVSASGSCLFRAPVLFINCSNCPFCLCRSFIGITAEGINRELATTLESAALCRNYSTCKSLAIPETSILRMADNAPDVLRNDMHLQATHFGSHRTEYVLSWWEIIRGILPSLRYIVYRDNVEFASRSQKIRPSESPDTDPKEEQNGIDPYGNDYFCNICSHELANTYFHCHGCESLLAKDFNICIGCHNDGAFAINVEMHKCGKTAMASHFHHVGQPKSQCANPTKHNMKCSECDRCLLCNCICHTVFQKRRRFYAENRQREMLQRCEELVKGCEIKYHQEAESQLFDKPMTSKHETSSNEVVSTGPADIREAYKNDECTAQTEAVDIVSVICQPKQNNDIFNGGSDISEDVDCVNLPVSPSTKTLGSYENEMQCMDTQGPCDSVNGALCKDKLATLKTPPHSVDVIDVDVDHDDSMDSDWNAGDLQNVGARNQSMFVEELCPRPTESVTIRTSVALSSTTATVLDDSAYSMSPCIVPIDSSERVEYDAV